MDLQGSRTQKNLMTAFTGESQARNRYSYYAGVARKEGFVQISEIFAETADQEKEHAKRFFKFMTGGTSMSGVNEDASFPFGAIGSTAENLKAAAAGEQYEWSQMYPGFSAIAREEGFDEIADAMESIAVAEKNHEKRYRALAENIESGRVFKRKEPVVWRCRNCGYLHEGVEAPHTCPACLHLRAHFELLGENW